MFAQHVLNLMDGRFKVAVYDTLHAPLDAPFDMSVSQEAACDVIYTCYMAGRSERLTAHAADRFAARLSATQFAANITGLHDKPIATVGVHNTAYALGALALFSKMGHNRFASVLKPQAFDFQSIIDHKTGIPRFPEKFRHHNWRVSHWLGGAPALLATLARFGNDDVKALLVPPFEASAVVDACAQVVDQKTGVFRCYKSELLQQLFRFGYRLRHAPDLGDQGGISHLLWVQHVLDKPIYAVEAIFEENYRLLLQHTPFMEAVPYCLDFDIIQNVRYSGEHLGRIDEKLQKRGEQLYNDISHYLEGDVPAHYTLHKIPGALAAMHEAAILSPTLLPKIRKDFGLEQGIDIILESGWI